jgi:putative heme-binding domain-containing protein
VTDATDDRVRSVAIQALAIDGRKNQPNLAAVQDVLRTAARKDESLANRVLAVRSGGGSADVPLQDQPLPVSAALLESLEGLPPPTLARASRHNDPYVAHAAVMALARRSAQAGKSASPLAQLLAAKRNRVERPGVTAPALASSLASDDADVLFTAVKWIADDKLVEHRGAIARLLDRPRLDFQTFLAATSALGRLDGHKPQDRPAAKVLIDKITDDKANSTLRRFALQLIDPKSPALKLDHLKNVANHPEAELRIAAIRTLASRPLTGQADAASLQLLADIADAPNRPAAERAFAVNGLALVAETQQDRLVRLALENDVLVRDAALRALVGVELKEKHERQLDKLAQRDASTIVLDRPGDPTAGNSAGDASAGRHVFFDVKIAKCARCHAIDGRGQQVGPDLSAISARIAAAGEHGRKWLLETILQPSKDMAPHFTPWQIVTTDGRTLLGLPRRKGGKRETYLGIDGREFAVQKADIEFHQESQTSIMPEGLLDELTRKELNDLIAFILE